jgi:sirohydrochlorin cobaltochelatase
MHQHGYIGRKMRQPKLHEKPAIIITAFGSSSRAKAAIDSFAHRIKEQYREYDIFWAYSSEIIRRKEGTKSLQETLAHVETLGYRKVVVQPLHIFPGTEYQQIAETCEFFPGVRVFLSETLMHRWDFIEETLAVVETEFLPEHEGLNILALHGTPLAADPVNVIYLGINNMISDLYTNVLAASIEGIPYYNAVLKRIKRLKLNTKYKKVKIIPMMFLAGIHVEDDLMGTENSWRCDLEKLGFTVECPTINHVNKTYFKGLAFYPEITEFLLCRLDRTLELARYY